jgi:hypothetical protein
MHEANANEAAAAAAAAAKIGKSMTRNRHACIKQVLLLLLLRK